MHLAQTWTLLGLQLLPRSPPWGHVSFCLPLHKLYTVSILSVHVIVTDVYFQGGNMHTSPQKLSVVGLHRPRKHFACENIFVWISDPQRHFHRKSGSLAWGCPVSMTCLAAQENKYKWICGDQEMNSNQTNAVVSSPLARVAESQTKQPGRMWLPYSLRWTGPSFFTEGDKALEQEKNLPKVTWQDLVVFLSYLILIKHTLINNK